MNRFVPKVDLIGDLDDFIKEYSERAREYRSPRELPHLYPTEASVQWTSESGLTITEGTCHRAVWYRLNDCPRDEDYEARLYWIWWLGHTFEKKCTELSKFGNILGGQSIKVVDRSLPLEISGEIDAVNLTDEGEFYVIDYKTAGGSYFVSSKLLGNSKKKPSPKTENLLQLLVYMKIDRRFKFGMLLYMIRDMMKKAQFQVELGKDEDGTEYAIVNGDPQKKYSINEIYRRYALICDYYQRKVLPPREYDFKYTLEKGKLLHKDGLLSKSKLADLEKGKPVGDWQCAYCAYASICKQESE